MTVRVPYFSALRGAARSLTRRLWRPALVVTLAGLGIAGTSLPASAARTDDFAPGFNTNPVCVQADGVTARPFVPSYQQRSNNVYAIVNDDDGATTVSTYTKGSQWCIRADWTFDAAAASGTCQYWFYVPNDVNLGNTTGIGADATFVVGFYGPDGHTLVAHSDPVYEAADAGLTQLTINGQGDLPANFTGINLGDNNGQAPGSAQIGFGAVPAQSLKRICP
jgi:hypothetical protein